MILILFGALMTVGTHMALAVAQSQQGNIQVNGTVEGPPPTQGASITSPTSNQRFTDKIITVSGSCVTGTIVQIYKNGIFAGTEYCDFGSFSLSIDLVPGRNDLVARTMDTLGQYGPNSPTITVFYDQVIPSGNQSAASSAAPQAPNAAIASNLLLDVMKLYQAGLPNRPVTIDIGISGGVGPYALYIDWGDGKNDLVLQPKSGDLKQQHTYDKPGNYRVIIEASDAEGNRATIQTIVMVNGEFKVTAPSILGDPDKALPILSIAWQIYIVIVLGVLCFWLGERSILHRYRTRI